MYEILIQKIKETLLSIEGMKAVYFKPLEGASKVYPMVHFGSGGSENTFETQSENKRVLTFNLIAEITTANIDETLLFETVLPKFVDSIYAKFNKNWGSYIGGKRMTWVVNDGQWLVSVEEKGRLASVPLVLKVMVLEDIS